MISLIFLLKEIRQSFSNQIFRVPMSADLVGNHVSGLEKTGDFAETQEQEHNKAPSCCDPRFGINYSRWRKHFKDILDTSFSSQIFPVPMSTDLVGNQVSGLEKTGGFADTQQQERIELPSCGESWVLGSDYDRCLKHKVGDFDDIPEKLLKDIQNFAVNSFTAAVLTYLKIDPDHHARAVTFVQQEGFVYPPYAFTKEQEYDLCKATILLFDPPWISTKIEGKRAVGSAIRICMAVGRPDVANKYYDMVKDCFIPDEYQDPTDSMRGMFGLAVEPSKGGIQCNCCTEDEQHLTS